ncbi:uncharacterized protein LOC131847198 [Achroia grisella]|uniref:uncharacterized protein LOC131847198 n=1 Tax=Achroia grisella TaxID=688607 RepID=UPI0027D26E32|nr:uncharacterized protein LOC131847198 [Achroia grisella]
MYKWRLLLLASLAIFQPIESFAERSLVDGRQECSERQPHTLQRDTRLSVYASVHHKKLGFEERRANYLHEFSKSVKTNADFEKNSAVIRQPFSRERDSRRTNLYSNDIQIEQRRTRESSIREERKHFARNSRENGRNNREDKYFRSSRIISETDRTVYDNTRSRIAISDTSRRIKESAERRNLLEQTRSQVVYISSLNARNRPQESRKGMERNSVSRFESRLERSDNDPRMSRRPLERQTTDNRDHNRDITRKYYTESLNRDTIRTDVRNVGNERQTITTRLNSRLLNNGNHRIWDQNEIDVDAQDNLVTGRGNRFYNRKESREQREGTQIERRLIRERQHPNQHVRHFGENIMELDEYNQRRNILREIQNRRTIDLRNDNRNSMRSNQRDSEARSGLRLVTRSFDRQIRQNNGQRESNRLVRDTELNRLKISEEYRDIRENEDAVSNIISNTETKIFKSRTPLNENNDRRYSERRVARVTREDQRRAADANNRIENNRDRFVFRSQFRESYENAMPITGRQINSRNDVRHERKSVNRIRYTNQYDERYQREERSFREGLRLTYDPVVRSMRLARDDSGRMHRNTLKRESMVGDSDRNRDINVNRRDMNYRTKDISNDRELDSRLIESARHRDFGSLIRNKTDPKYQTFVLSWQHLFYTMQGVYVCTIIMQMLSESKSRAKKVSWWNPGSFKIPVKVD